MLAQQIQNEILEPNPDQLVWVAFAAGSGHRIAIADLDVKGEIPVGAQSRVGTRSVQRNCAR